MVLKRGIPLALVVIIFVTPIILGAEFRLMSQEREKILFREIPMVITASRKEQPLIEAPSAVTVITADDIRYSGAISIPELLRQVAGVDVMAITARDQQVAIHGFIGPLSNKVLVLIDGRSIYEDLYGSVLWGAFTVGLAEIERIEVIKSPASSLYGANAFSGVINIITKSPQQLEGTTLDFTVGTRDTLIASILHAGKAAKNKIRYKITSQWDQTNEWGEQAESAGSTARVNAQIEYTPNKKSQLLFAGGWNRVKDRKFFPDALFGTGKLNNSTRYFKFGFEYSQFKFRTFFKQTEGDVVWLQGNERQSWQSSIYIYDADLQHSTYLGKSHSLVWGINYRHNLLNKNFFFPEDYHQDLWALFIEDEISITGKLRFTLGGRYDRHPLAGGRISPRATIFYSPSLNHIIRFSMSKAFRNPYFTLSYVDIEQYSDITLPPPLPPITLPSALIIQGNPNLEPEGITAFEMGYHFTRFDRLQLDVNLFYHQYTGFFLRNLFVDYYQENEISPGSPGGIIPKTTIMTFQNGPDAWGIGGEVNLDFLLSQGISGFVNYSFLQITGQPDFPYSTYVSKEKKPRPEYPKHKINAGLRVIFKKGFSLNLLAHWVDHTKKFIPDPNFDYYLAAVDDYFLFNVRLGVSFWKEKAELGLSIFNLFNDKHFEYPFDPNFPIPTSDEIGRRVTVSLRIEL